MTGPIAGGIIYADESVNQGSFTWQDFTPKVYTAAVTTPTEVSGTVGYAKYLRVGNTVWAVASVAFGAGTSGGAAIDLPVPAALRLFNCGTCWLTGSSLPSGQSGIAFMLADNSKLAVVTAGTGFLDASSGHNIRYSVCYPAEEE
jgi:hypothetical protein